MSVVRINTANTMGVRRLMSGAQRSFRSSRPHLTGYHVIRGLGDMGSLGDDTSDAVSDLTTAGYDPVTLQMLVAQGASAQQLYNLPYGAGTTTDDMGSGVYALQAQLHGAPVIQGQTVPGATPTLNIVQPQMTGTQFQQSLGLPGGSVGIANTITSASNLPVPPPPQPPQTLEQWIMANGWWIAGIAAALVIAPPLIKAVTKAI